jgi:hypothetical protein
MVKKINETASAGAMGGGSIAVKTSRGFGEKNSPQKLIDFLKDFFNRNTTKLDYKPVTDMIPKKINKLYESTDISDVFATLKNSEYKSVERKDTVVFGIEDDDGNIMRITLPSEQGNEFEIRVSKELAEIEDFKKSGHVGKNMSMAELLYELKKEFDILDVDFPKIPSDVIYNEKNTTTSVEEVQDDFNQDENLEKSDDMEMQDMDDMNGAPDGSDMQDMDDMEDDSVEDFEEPQGNSAESILASVMATLKAQADAEKAKADAEAEKAKAQQAEYSSKIASMEMDKQQQMMEIEAEMDAQKEKEKEAKKMADIARHNYQKNKMMASENFKFSPMMYNILESDQFDSIQSLQREKINIRTKYAPSSTDTVEQKMYKQEQMRLALKELMAKIQQVRSRDNFNKKQQIKDDELKKNQEMNASQQNQNIQNGAMR